MKNPVRIILSIVVVIVSAGAALLYTQNQKLQAANSKLSTQLTGTNSKLDALQSANSNLTAQLTEANSQFTSATSQLAEVSLQLDAANQEITQMRPEVQRARTMPIVITCREALLKNNGYVYTFLNRSRTTLAFHVILTNPAFGQPKEFHLVIDGGLSKEIGWYQGWPGASGDTIKVECAGYDPLVKTTR